MIEFVSGDFFDYDADIRINTVNCVGVMGAGVALEFKNRYPDMFKAYVEVCKKGEIAPGKPYVWEEVDLFSRCIIINLPTKVHWRNPSEYEYIEKDLVWLKDYLQNVSENFIVTLPALGCGHGALEWNIVRNMICHYMEGIRARILVFEPSASNKEFENVHYRHILQKDNVRAIYPSDKSFPRNLEGQFEKEIYCKGNFELLAYPRVSLICGNRFSEKQNFAIYRVLEELSKGKYVYVLAWNNKCSEELAISLLERGYKLILIIPYGIMNIKRQCLIWKYSDEFLVISYNKPKQEFKKYEYIISLKFRLKIADAILYCDDNRDDIRKIIKYFKGYRNIFYINYWNSVVNEFVEIGAQKIGLDPLTKKPNVLSIQKYIEECSVSISD
ncbi:MAG: macro domain-containing protein [Lachnospiraceae bacterium]|nr:macro domain-containing protein [Lachnospiraceae bacterium]